MNATAAADSAGAPALLQRSPIWFDDGNVVLEAQSTQFRVHKSILSENSPVFGDMFSMPQTRDPHDVSVEGCPVVHMQDGAEDVYHFLKSLYNRTYFRDRGFQPFEKIAAVLRLGTKYQVQHLRDDAIHRLQSEFPHTLDAWDSAKDRWVSISEPEMEYSRLVPLLVNIARENNVLSVLPAALYHICSWPNQPGDIVEWDMPLTVEDKFLCIRARDGLIRDQLQFTWCWIQAGCGNPACDFALLTLFNRLWAPTPHCRALDDWDETHGVGLCPECLTTSEQSMATGRQEIWKRLPSYFDLPEWDVLLKADD